MTTIAARNSLLLLVLLLISLISSRSLGAAGLSLSGGYLNSRLEHKSSTQSFSLSSESGSRAGAELTLGVKKFELFFLGQIKQQNFSPPVTKTLLESKQTLSEYGGLRYKLSSANFFVGYLSSEHTYLTEIDSTQFEAKKIAIPLALAGAQVSAWTRAYTIALRLTAGTQVSAASVPDSELKSSYEYFGTGDALIEYGRFWKIGAQAGADVRKYKIEASTTTQEFFFSVFFRVGGSGNGFANEKYAPLFGN